MATAFLVGTGMLQGCVLSEEDHQPAVSSTEREVRFNFVVSRAGLQVIDGVRLTPNILLMTETQKDNFDSQSDYLQPGDYAYTHLIEVLGKVNDYNIKTYNTGVEYESSGETYWARGYAPAIGLTPKTLTNGALDYRELTLDPSAVVGATLPLGRIDFLSLDADPAYQGSLNDKFGQEKNKLYFRHLTSQFLFVARRDTSMIDMQYVRDVKLSNIQICYYNGGGKAPTADDQGWMPFSYPVKLRWTPGAANAHSSGSSVYGYKVTEMKDLPDAFSIRTSGKTQLMVGRDVGIDSLFVNVRTKRDADTDLDNTRAKSGVFLKMDVSALLSHLDNFPLNETSTLSSVGENGLTHTVTWTDVIIPVHEIGEPQTLVRSIETGKRYKISLVFGRHNLYLDAVLVDWKDGGIHDYVFRPGDLEVDH